MPTTPAPSRFGTTFTWGFFAAVAYLVTVFAMWSIMGMRYDHITDSVDTIRDYYAIPTLVGSAVLVAILAWRGLLKPALRDPYVIGPKWLWIFPILGIVIPLLIALAGVPQYASASLLIWLALGALGVGLGEELAIRGALLIAIRDKYNEAIVFVVTTVAFSLMHAPNFLFKDDQVFGFSQLQSTLLAGCAYYLIRRATGSLWWAVAAHGLWDSCGMYMVYTAQAAGGEFDGNNLFLQIGGIGSEVLMKYVAAVVAVVLAVRSRHLFIRPVPADKSHDS